MKKFAASFLAVVLFFTAAVISSSVFAASSGAAIAVSDKTVEAGEEFTVEVTLKDNPGIISYHILLEYDSDVFEVTGFENGHFSKDEAAEKGTSENAPSNGPFENNPFSFLWHDATHGNYTSNGTLAIVTFKVKNDAKPGTYEIKPTQNDGDFFNSNFDDQPFTTKTGTITVKGPAVRSVTVTPTSIEFKKAGETKQLTTTVLPENAGNKKVTYKSANTSVAAVDENGLVTAVGEGVTEITVTTADGGYTASCTVTVNHEHKMQKIEEKASTCTTQGNNEYYYCTLCKKYFKDSNGQQATTADAEKRPLASHNFTKKVADADHLKSKATCKSPAVYYYSCEVCGKISDTLTFENGTADKTNHDGKTEVRNASKATCTEDGFTGNTYCLGCGEKIKDGDVIPAGHTFAEEWKSDENGHWKECTVCGAKSDVEEHKFGKATCVKPAECEVCGIKSSEKDPENHEGETEIRNQKAPTVEEEGYTGDTYCLGCGQKIKDGEVIPKHVHKLEKVEAVAATEEKEGNIAYYRCSGCAMLFKDEAGTQPITIEEIVTEKLPPKTEDDKGESSNPPMGAASAAAGVLVLGAVGAFVAFRKKRK